MVNKFLDIQHRLNPLHVYCRFLDRGLNKRFSASVCKVYEMLIYLWVGWIIKTIIFSHWFLNRSWSLQKAFSKKYKNFE